jgi:hypothetical protein
MERIKMEQLKFWENTINEELKRLGKNTRIRVVERDNHIAIEKLDEQGIAWDMLTVELTKREALNLLVCIHSILNFD